MPTIFICGYYATHNCYAWHSENAKSLYFKGYYVKRNTYV